jgi:hypothetical protein
MSGHIINSGLVIVIVGLGIVKPFKKGFAKSSCTIIISNCKITESVQRVGDIAYALVFGLGSDFTLQSMYCGHMVIHYSY